MAIKRNRPNENGLLARQSLLEKEFLEFCAFSCGNQQMPKAMGPDTRTKMRRATQRNRERRDQGVGKGRNRRSLDQRTTFRVVDAPSYVYKVSSRFYVTMRAPITR